MKTKRKWISKVALSLGVLTMLGSAGAGLGSVAYATPDVPYVSTNAISDETSDRTITLWKYEIKSAAELKDRDNGEMLDPADPKLKDKELMEGVDFEIVRVIPNETSLGSGEYKKLDDPTKQKEGASEDYTIDMSFNNNTGKMTGTTGADGKLTFNVGKGKAADGIYLIREVADANGDYWYMKDGEKTKVATPMAPFFAYLPQTKRDNENELIYDVHVYPKNIVNDTSADKTVEGQKGYSIKAGEAFQWEATVKLPTGLYFEAKEDMTITNVYNPVTKENDGTRDVVKGEKVYANEFFIHDELSEKLHLDNVEVEAYNPTTKTWDKLVFNTDYKVTKNGTEATASPITNANGAPIDVRVDLKDAGMEKLEGTYDQIRVIYHTHTEVDFNGVIENKFDFGYLIPGQKPFTDETENNPEYYDGGFTIDKTKEDKNEKLEGAEFYIATSEQNAKDGIFLASNGQSYRLKADKDDPTGKPAQDPKTDGAEFLTDTTDSTGKAQFDGLALDWYTDANGNKKQDSDEPTWPKVDPKDGSPFISRDYWLVETKSPDGYELLKTPKKVTVTLYPTDTTVHVENKIQTKLPFTGGTGTTLLIIIAIGAITIGTAAIAIDKKRRAV